MNFFIRTITELQEITLLTWRVIRSLFRPPVYWREMVVQMDALGFGSLVIILLTGTFTGGVLCLNSANTLQKFGFGSQTGQLVTTSLIRELGPVLTCLMLAGRVGSGIAAEIGSMLVSEQIDAMRALGTDPVKKLVAPRIIAMILMTPLLTIICDLMGVLGGLFVATSQMNQSSAVYLASTQDAITMNEILAGLIKPLVFGFIIAVVGCYKGLNTRGGTVGVGLATTQSVVVSSTLVIVVDFLLTKLLIATLLNYQN